MTKEEFRTTIREGKWFQVHSKYGQIYAVKMQENQTGRIQSLWLSFQDPEAMCFSEYLPKEWDLKDGVFITYSAGVYHFGSQGDSREGSNDCIYKENTGEIIESRMKQQIMNYASEGFITEQELDDVWFKLKERTPLEFDILLCNE